MILHFNNTELEIRETEDSFRYSSLMGENYILLKFNLAEYIDIPVGAWCEFKATKYTLEAPANLKKLGERIYEYTLMMQSSQSELAKYKFRNSIDKRLKWSMNAKPHEFISEIVANLNMRSSGWSAGACIEASEKTIAFNHLSVDDALQSIANAFETEWEIVNKVIHLRKVEYNKSDPLPLSYGKGNGFVPGVGRISELDKKPIDILFTQGGERNIDRSKYGSAELLLPKAQTLSYEGRAYVSDEHGYSIKRSDRPLRYNTEDSLDCTSIYPKRIGVVNEVELINEEKNLYDIIDTSIPENLDFNDLIIEGETPTVIFQTGMLAGKEFEFQYKHDERRFELVPQDIDGYIMPGDVYVPRVNDTYAVYGIMLPDAYISDNATKTGASWDMFREAARCLYENEEQKFTFIGELQGLWAKENWLIIGGK
nr:hypothetical protein [Dysgonamonadaceae bacterium]